MGGGSGWTADDWDDFSASATKDASGADKTIDEIFASDIKPEFDPLNIKVRESCDSDDNPQSTPIIVALDGTGSMGMIPNELIKDGLNRLVSTIHERKPVTNPHIMFMMVGDADYGPYKDHKHDKYPLQVTQFEADLRIAQQLKDLHIEKGGGGNYMESYHLPWYFAAKKTSIDSFKKRGQKGILFTIGDEGVEESLRAEDIKRVIGDDVMADIPTEDLLRMVQERYDVFHLAIQQGDCYSTKHQAKWKELLGENLIPIADYKKVPEVVISVLEVIGGRPKHEVTASWDGSTALVVRDAISGLTPGSRSLAKFAPGGSPTVWRPPSGAGSGGRLKAPELTLAV